MAVEWAAFKATSSTQLLSTCKVQMRYSEISSEARIRLLISLMMMMISLAEASADIHSAAWVACMEAWEACMEEWVVEWAEVNALKEVRRKIEIRLEEWEWVVASAIVCSMMMTISSEVDLVEEASAEACQ